MSANELPTIRQKIEAISLFLPLVPFLASWGEEYRAARSDAGHLPVGFKKVEIELPYDPANPLLGIHIKETRTERDTCTPVFITALFIVVYS